MSKVCKCRFCGISYDPYTSRADYTGYCSQSCLHDQAKKLGYKKRRDSSEYDVLKKAGKVGNINLMGDPCDYLGRRLPKIVHGSRPNAPQSTLSKEEIDKLNEKRSSS